MTAVDLCRRNITNAQRDRIEEVRRNRDTMPVVAAIVEETRKIFGDGVRVKYAAENSCVISRNPLGEYE